MKTETAPTRIRPLQAHFAPALQHWERSFQAEDGHTDQATGAAMAGLTDCLIEDAISQRATDIHLEPEYEGVCVRLRVDGLLHDAALLSKDVGHRLIGHIKAITQIDPIPLSRPASGRANYPHERGELYLRVACVPCLGGEKVSIRLLDANRLQLNLTDLGLEEEHYSTVERWLKNISGMFLVVGPTGSGKTTTLYALLHELKIFNQSVVTIEDPVEYRIEGITQMQVNEARGLTFGEGVKAMLRLDPDFLLVGEVRDVASAHAALEVASSGKALLSTLHSRDAAGTVTTLRNLQLKDFEIATALEVVVAQRLVRKLCSDCSKKGTVTDADKAWLESAGLAVPESVRVAGECGKCQYTGYRGRTGLFEVWRLDESFKQLVLAHAEEARLRRQLREGGVHPITHDGIEKVRKGITSLSELQRPGA